MGVKNLSYQLISRLKDYHHNCKSKLMCFFLTNNSVILWGIRSYRYYVCANQFYQFPQASDKTYAPYPILLPYTHMQSKTFGIQTLSWICLQKPLEVSLLISTSLLNSLLLWVARLKQRSSMPCWV